MTPKNVFRACRWTSNCSPLKATWLHFVLFFWSVARGGTGDLHNSVFCGDIFGNTLKGFEGPFALAISDGVTARPSV